MAYLFSRRQGISSHLQTIWVNGSFILVLYRNWCSYRLEMGVSGNLCIVSKGYQATFCIWCGMWDGYGFNELEMFFILSWFGLHQSILHSWGDISLLLLWQGSSGFSSDPSVKSRFITSFIGNTELLNKKCRGISLIFRRGGSLMSFLELWQAPGV